jgi:hypothetical protein
MRSALDAKPFSPPAIASTNIDALLEAQPPPAARQSGKRRHERAEIDRAELRLSPNPKHGADVIGSDSLLQVAAGLRALIEQSIGHLVNAWSLRRWRACCTGFGTSTGPPTHSAASASGCTGYPHQEHHGHPELRWPTTGGQRVKSPATSPAQRPLDSPGFGVVSGSRTGRADEGRSRLVTSASTCQSAEHDDGQVQFPRQLSGVYRVLPHASVDSPQTRSLPRLDGLAGY